MSDVLHALALLWAIVGIFYTWFVAMRWIMRKGDAWIERRKQARLARLTSGVEPGIDLVQEAVPMPDVGDPNRCKNCGTNTKTEKWYEGSLGVTHGFYEWWCPRCILQAQIAYATKQAARIPMLEAELASLGAE